MFSGHNGQAPRRGRRAFSLVELFVAMGVLFVALYAIYGQFFKTRDLAARNLKIAQGRLVARQGLEELRACSYEDLIKFSPSDDYEPMENRPGFFINQKLEIESDPNRIAITTRVAWDPIREKKSQKFLEGRVAVAKGLRYP